MKRTPLKRKTPLKAKTGLKRTGFKTKSKTLSSKRPRSTIKPKRDYYKTKADRLWQELMYELWGHRCARCGRPLKKEEATGHHMIRREIYHLRHHPKCGILLGDGCHNHAEDAPHNHSPELFMAFVKERYPVSYQWVQEHKNEYGKKPDYREVCVDLERRLKETRKEKI